jgi:hypothetical protein
MRRFNFHTEFEYIKIYKHAKLPRKEQSAESEKPPSSYSNLRLARSLGRIDYLKIDD